MKGVNFLLVLILSTGLLSAGNIYTKEQNISISSAYYFPNTKGLTLNNNFAPVSYNKIEAESSNQRDIGSTFGAMELKLAYKLSFSKPFLTGTSFLTKDNKIKYTFIGEISPVSIESGGEIMLTPIAFLDITFGSTIATGWKAIGVTGLGLNNDSSSQPDDSAFQGVLSNSWLSGTIKFDTAAVLTGDTTWKHIVLLSSHKLVYRHFSAANNIEPWVYQGGEGNKFNGYIYSHTSFVGYQMPLTLEKIGFLVETESNLFDIASQSKSSTGGWGSDFIKLRIGALLNFKLNKNHSIAIIPQFTTARNYTDNTIKEFYFKNREVDSNSPEYWSFERIALIYNYKF